MNDLKVGENKTRGEQDQWKPNQQTISNLENHKSVWRSMEAATITQNWRNTKQRGEQGQRKPQQQLKFGETQNNATIKSKESCSDNSNTEECKTVNQAMTVDV